MAIYIPFNHMPTATGQHATTYTVPANKYARVVVHLSTAGRAQGISGTLYAPSGTAISDLKAESFSSNNSISEEFWLRAAETITITTSAPAQNVVAPAGGVVLKQFTANINVTATASKSGVVILRSDSNAIYYGSATAAANDIVGALNSTAEGGIYYEEYNVIGT